MACVHESARTIPVTETCEVIVCGGGPAGVAAAVAAGRQGASVRLLECQGQIGGIWTSGLLAWILDSRNKPGILDEIFIRLEKRQAAPPRQYGSRAADVEALKLILEEMCLEAGVRLRYHTRVVAAIKDAQGRLTACLTESKSGREAWRAKIFIDCTGDGDLGALAGCEFALGQPGTGLTQPFSLMAYLAGPTVTEIKPFVHISENPWPTDCERILQALRSVGVEPSYHRPILIPVQDDLYIMMANHEYRRSAINAQDVTDATVHARAEVHTLVEGFKRLGGPWTKLRLVGTSAQIGTREGRRLVGRYMLTQDDLVRGATFDDAVCRVTFGVDVHALDPSKNKGIDAMGVRSQPYDIPLRALLARDVPNLMMAGRCISGDFIAHSSYRVTGNAVAMGQAAGIVAARAASQNKLPHEVSWEALRPALGLPADNR